MAHNPPTEGLISSTSQEMPISFGSAAFIAPDFSPISSYWLEHIPFAFWLVEQAKPELLVELGVHTGGSYCNFCEAIKIISLDCRCYGIDNFEGDPHYISYGPEILETLKAYHDPRYKEFSTLIKSDFQQALKHFPDGVIDILHIDGTHFYEDVRRDFETWKPKLSRKAVVLFHDTNVRERDFGVHQLWQELRQIHAGFEFHHCNGLGVLVPGEMPSEAIRQLVESSPEQAARIRKLFCTLGDRVTRKAQQEQNSAIIAKFQEDDGILRDEIRRKECAITKLQEDDGVLRDEIRRKECAITSEAETRFRLEQAIANLQADNNILRDEIQKKESAATAAEYRLEQSVADLHGERNELLSQLLALENAGSEAGTAKRKEITEIEKKLAEAELRTAVAKERLDSLTAQYESALGGIEDAAKQRYLDLQKATAAECTIDRDLITARIHLKQHWGDTNARFHLIRRLRQSWADNLAISRVGLLSQLQLGSTSSPHPVAAAVTRKVPSAASPGSLLAPDPLEKSGLFDETFYRSQFKPSEPIPNALAHYRSVGWLLGYRPNRLFDPLWYARTHKLSPGVEPLLDYVTEGHITGRNPHPLFDLAHYRRSNPDLEDYIQPLFHHFINYGIYEKRNPLPLFDVSYYASRSPDVEIEDALDHYFHFGAWEGRNPHPLFDSAFYIRENASVLGEMENPLLHYLANGHLPEFSPHPLFDASAYVTLNGIDAGKAGNLLLHYLQHGLEDRSQPHYLFDAARYLELRNDVLEAGINPLMHYCIAGAFDLSSPHLLFDAAYYVSGNPEIASVNPLMHYLDALGRGCPNPHPLFDSDYYLAKYADVRKSEVPPLLHFVKAAPSERRQPHPLFDTEFYLESYRDVAGLGMNGLSHYLLIGAEEGRMPNPFFETRHYRKMAMKGDETSTVNPLIHFALCDFDQLESPGRFFDIPWYLQTYADVAESRINPLVHFLTTGSAEKRQPCGSLKVREKLESKYPGITHPAAISNWGYLKHRLRQPKTAAVESEGQIRLNMLFPDLDAQIVFGGYIAALEFLAAFSDRYDIRLLSTMQKMDGTNLRELKAKFASNPRISRMLAKAKLEDLSDPDFVLPVHPQDVFCAYSVWDAFLCDQLARSMGQNEFIYFCQEDEAIFHCNDSLHALARMGQKLSSFQIFNTTILRDHFRIQKLGVFSRGEEAGMLDSISFQHALVDTRPPSINEMKSRGKIRVLLYARPEDHAKRNLFEITLLGIDRYLERHPEGADELEFTGVGSMHFDGDVMLNETTPLHIKPKLSYSDYAKSLAEFDIGISLMYAPHPSILPFEMASAGLVVVTNQYEERDASVIGAISGNLVAVDPTPDGIADGIETAISRVTNYEARVQAAEFPWSRDWALSFNNDFTDQVASRIQLIAATGQPTVNS